MNIFQREDANSSAKNTLSRLLTIVQVTGMVALALLVGFATYWISSDFNALSAADTRRMISGGISSLEETLRTVTLDHSISREAYEAIRDRDADWMWSNFGAGTVHTGTTDLMMVIEAGEAVQFGWTRGIGREPASDLLPADVISTMLRLLDDSPAAEREVVTRFVVADGQTWLLAISRVMPHTGPPAGITDKDLPRHLLGTQIDNALMVELGAQFLVSDLQVAPTPLPGMSSLALGDTTGSGGYAVWTPPRPGDQILGRLAVPLLLLFGILMLVSRHVIRMAGRLEFAVDAAQAADHSKTEFLANISHELRTPMNGIIGIGQLIQKTDLDPKTAKLMDVLMTSARSEMVLIEDLLDLSRIDSGNRQRDLSPFDPVAALNEVRDMMGLRAETKGIDFNVETPAGLDIHVLGDKGGFNQILTNLISNAIKFTDQGHVTVRMQATPVHKRVRPDQVRLTVEVTDSGPGVDPKNHELIFERFGQVDETSVGEAPGVGLGLAITKSLVDMMGGKLGLTSELGKGSTFSIDLPFDVVAALEPRPPAK